MRKAVFALVAALAVPFAAHAATPIAAPAAQPMQAAQSPYYVTAKLGVYVPQSSDLDLFNTGLNTDVRVGYRMNENFAAELGLGYFATSTDEVSNSKITLSSFPLTATAKGILPFGQLEAYGLAGVGLYVSQMEVKLLGNSVSDSETGFGFHVGAGGDFALTNQISLGAEARYLIASVNDLSMDGFQLNVGAAFHF